MCYKMREVQARANGRQFLASRSFSVAVARQCSLHACMCCKMREFQTRAHGRQFLASRPFFGRGRAPMFCECVHVMQDDRSQNEQTVVRFWPPGRFRSWSHVNAPAQKSSEIQFLWSYNCRSVAPKLTSGSKPVDCRLFLDLHDLQCGPLSWMVQKP